MRPVSVERVGGKFVVRDAQKKRVHDGIRSSDLADLSTFANKLVDGAINPGEAQRLDRTLKLLLLELLIQHGKI